MSNDETLLRALTVAFSSFPERTATVEALIPLVSQQLKRIVNARLLERTLNAHPIDFQRDNAGRWTYLQKGLNFLDANDGLETEQPEDNTAGQKDWSRLKA